MSSSRWFNTFRSKPTIRSGPSIWIWIWMSSRQGTWLWHHTDGLCSHGAAWLVKRLLNSGKEPADTTDWLIQALLFTWGMVSRNTAPRTPRAPRWNIAKTSRWWCLGFNWISRKISRKRRISEGENWRRGEISSYPPSTSTHSAVHALYAVRCFVTSLNLLGFRNYRPIKDTGFRKFWWILWISTFSRTATISTNDQHTIPSSRKSDNTEPRLFQGLEQWACNCLVELGKLFWSKLLVFGMLCHAMSRQRHLCQFACSRLKTHLFVCLFPWISLCLWSCQVT